MIEHLRKALDIPRTQVVPFEEWLWRVRQAPASLTQDIPASSLVDFLESHFVRMSCGGVVLDTAKTAAHCEPLQRARSVDEDLVMKYIQKWRAIGFLR